MASLMSDLMDMSLSKLQELVIDRRQEEKGKAQEMVGWHH